MNLNSNQIQEDEAYDLLASGNFSLARRKFQELCAAHSGEDSSNISDICLFNVANCYAKEGNPVEALNVLTQIGAVEDAGLAYTKALCLMKLSKFDQALICLDKISVDELMANVTHEQHKELAETLMELMSNLANYKSNYHHTKCKILETFMSKLKPIAVEHFEDGEYMWQKNLAHVLFMMDTRYRECSQTYNDIMLLPQQGKLSPVPAQASPDSLLGADPVVVSNLCVSYILTGQNREAERLIKEIEQEEDEEEGRQLVVADDDIDLSSSLYGLSGSNGATLQSMLMISGADLKQQVAHQALSSNKHSASHLIHINLAIGTLYCVKNNYEFGLTRIFETLEPLERKLTQFTWTQAKRCLLSLLDKHCRQLIYVRDDLFDQIVKFLIKCETHGVHVTCTNVSAAAPAAAPTAANKNNQQMSQPQLTDGRNSVTYEARYLRAIFLNVIHD